MTADPWRHRIRLEHELHDGPALRLSALTLRLGLLRHRTDDPAIRDGLAEAQDEVDAVLGELRFLASRLYPPLLDEAGLGPALRQVAETLPAQVDVVERGDRFGAALEGATYFAVVDALGAPSARGGPVTVTVGRDGSHDGSGYLALTLAGPDPSDTGRLQDTARALDGTVTTSPATTTVRIPCA